MWKGGELSRATLWVGTQSRKGQPAQLQQTNVNCRFRSWIVAAQFRS